MTLIQFAEDLTDRQAADAVRSRIDVKHLLGLELDEHTFEREQFVIDWRNESVTCPNGQQSRF